MEYFKTAVEGLEISRVGLGTWAMGGDNWGGIEDKAAVEAIQAALDMGVNLVDTAPVYGFGHSEENVGRALSAPGYRQKAILATKCGLSWNDKVGVYRDCRPETIRAEVEQSLRRLNTDYIDIYQIHWPDIKVPFAESAEEMLKLLREGKIRAIGVSNLSIQQMDEWQRTAPIHTIQPSYNILENKLFEDQIPYATKGNIAVLGYSALCRGMLSGKYHAGMKFNDNDMRAESDPKFQGQDFLNHLAAVEALKEYAKQFGKTVSQLAVRWVLDKGVSCALWGIRNKGQLEPIEGVMGWSLSPAQLDEMEAIVAKHVPVQVDKEFLTPPYRS